MRWSAVPFGKYQGKTLPEIIVRDLDWFFWVVPKLYGKLADEAEELARPVIPNRCNRKQPFSFSKRLYRLRWRIENAFNRLKDFRRVATRYDRLALNYLASVCLAAALVWWI